MILLISAFQVARIIGVNLSLLSLSIQAF
jgi:hypothetical protein